VSLASPSSIEIIFHCSKQFLLKLLRWATQLLKWL